MSDLLQRVAQSVRNRRLFHPGQRILVAVSGGVDSVVLLHLLHELSGKQHWELAVGHLNHRLRGQSSEADERLVRRTAANLKLPALVGAADVRQFAQVQKLSLEMAARKLRHEFLAQTARSRRISSIALAHHADDQLELFFLRLLRGSGGEGLAGMKWQSPSPADASVQLVRPLLDQPKTALLEYAAEQRIVYREDATNALPDFQRNRIRQELLPLLRSKYQPALDKTVLRVMEVVGAEAELAAQAAWEWLEGKGPRAEGRRPKEGRRAKSEEAALKRISFDGLPLAVQRWCVQLQLIEQGVVPDYELVEQLRLNPDRPVAVGAKAEITDKQGKGQGTGGTPVPHYAVRDQAGMVRLQVAEAQEFRCGVLGVDLEGRAGEVEFDGIRIWWSARERKAARQAKAGVGQESFDADKVGSPVSLRHWQPGDRFQPIGMGSSVKLQDFFTNQKVPRERRHRLILAATAQGEVFWVEGMRISERFKLTKSTNRCLQWRWKRL